MNKIFKVIYSKVRGCYVVVSEISRSNGKTRARHEKKSSHGGLLVAAVLAASLYGAEGTASADVVLGHSGAAAYDENGNLTIGKDVQAAGSNKAGRNNIAIGTKTDTIRDDGSGQGQALDDESNTKLVDGEGQAHKLNRSTESSRAEDNGSTAMGYDSHAEGDASTAIGNKAKVLNKPVTYYVDADGNKTTSQDNAAWYKDSAGKPTKVPQVFRDADNNTTTTPQYIHTYTETDATTGETVTKKEITTDASKADKNADGSLKYNYQKTDNTDKLYSVTLYQPSSNSIAAGSEVEADGENAVAVGYQSKAKSSAVAIGDNANAEKDSVAIGKQATANVEGGVALGMGSAADRTGNVSGWDPRTGKSSIDTTNVWKSGNGAVSVGNENGSRQITNVAAGSEDSDAVNLAQLKKAMIHYYSVKTTEATDQAGNNNYLNDGATGGNALAAGVNAKAFGDNSTAVGTESQAQGRDSAAYGYGAIAFQQDSTAMGSNAQAQARSSTAYGSSAIAKASGSTVIGYGSTSQGENAVAVGGHALADYSVQIGTSSTSQGKYSVAVGGHTKGENSVAVGEGATAQSKNSVAVGGHALGENSVQVGSGNTAQGKNSVAVGGHALGENTVEVGVGSTAQGANSVSVGGHAMGASSTAIGNGSNSAGTSSTAIGGGSTHNENETAVGSGSVTSGGKSVAVGGTATGKQSVSVGNNANATSESATTVGFNTSATGSQSTALGYNAHAGNYQSVAIGGSTANGNQAVAIGNGAAAGSYNSGYSGMTAVGQSSIANGQNSTALGYSSHAGGTNTTAIGSSNSSGSNTVAIGGASTSGLYTVAIGSGATADGGSSIAVGNGANVSGSSSTGVGAGTKASNSGTAVGNGVQAGGYQATAIGVGSNATGANATAIGGGGAWAAGSVAIGSGAGTNTNAVSIGKNSGAWGDSSVALGTGSSTKGANATAIGGGGAWEDNSVAIGSSAGANINAIAIGKSSGAWGDSAVAIGENTNAWRANSIVLGKNSESGADKNVQGFDPLTGKASTDSSAAWNSTDEAVSFGRAEERDEKGNVTKTAITRQLNNVAAGTLDTDAVNVAQLKLATTKINMHYYSVHSTETGDGSNYANDGATGTNALAAGVSASASGDSALAIGTNASSKAQHSIAVGTQTSAEKDSAVAIGYDTHAVNDSTVAIGSGTQARGRYSVALGLSSVAGTETNDANNPLDGGGSVAVGYGASAEATRSIAIGTAASASENAFTTALGDSSVAGQRGSVALGAGSNATRAAGNLEGGTEYKKAYLMPDTAAADDITWTSTEGAVSVGGTTKYIDYDESGKKVTKTKTITRQITNVAAGSEDTDAVNVAQLKQVETKASQHSTVSVGKVKAEKDDTEVSGGNLKLTRSLNDDKSYNYDVSLNDNVILGKDGKDGSNGSIGLVGQNGKDGKVTTVITTVGKNGTNGTDGKPGVDGTNITRLVYQDGKDGEAGATTYTIATLDDGQKYHGDFGDVANVALNHQVNIVGDISSYNANHPDSKVEQSALTDGTANVGVVTTKDDQGNATLTIKLNKDLTGLNSVTADGAKLGHHAEGDTSLTVYEIDANGNSVAKTDANGKVVTDKAGTYETGLTNKTWDGKTYVSGRAATEDQLMQITSSIVNQGTTGGFGLSANGQNVKQDLGKTIAINGDGTYDTDGKETAAGNISTSVEKGAIKVSLNKDLNINSTTMEKTNDDGSKVSNVTNAEGSTITKTDASGKQSSTTINAGSLTVKDGDGTTTIGGGSAAIGTVTINGSGENDGNDQHKSTIKGLSNTTFDTNHLEQYNKSDRAATEGQLKDVYDMASKHTTVTVNGKDAPSTDGNLILKKDDKNGSANYDLALNNDITLGDKDNNGKLTVKSKDGMKSVTTDGENGTLTFKDGENETAIKAAEAAKGVNGTTDIKRVAVDGSTVATMDDGMKFAGDSGDALKQKLNSTTNIKGGADAAKLSDGNIGIVSDGKDTLNVKLSKDIKGLDSIEAKTVNAETVNSSTFNAGNTTINNNGLTVKSDDGSRSLTVQDGNVSMGGNQIHNVAAGTADDDAVNVSQLKKMGGEISNVSRRVDRVGAGAAALAALHPQDFDPDDKWDFAVGYGNYRGANAAAVGAFYQPNEDTTLSIGGTVGGGENMVNAGISFKFGQGNHVTNSRVAMAKELLSLKDYVVKQDKMIQQQNEKIEKLEAMVGLSSGTPAEAKTQKRTLLFPDVPENHWAYDYVKKLADRGLLEGYPDGEFKGSRTLTRYEFAAIFERALENGAAADGDMERMAEEFDPEIRELSLSRFRVDRVSGDDNDHNKVERVRVNSRDEVVQQKNGEKSKIYRDVYGGQIDKAEAAAEK
ncbi:ESPR-type extended signal peptide-containing protein [uncultured Mitsuokella sp.]|uniref:ESPR-type extended signal peptide-containing protein n=1 Tax=uncultured Mitsuokella sp. TaxID=453120 RepID=UPI00267013C6|nr:ESPR-type extended signal peptide-containing protein [uncultured Mitsuokella sp.]